MAGKPLDEKDLLDTHPASTRLGGRRGNPSFMLTPEAAALLLKDSNRLGPIAEDGPDIALAALGKCRRLRSVAGVTSGNRPWAQSNMSGLVCTMRSYTGWKWSQPI